MSSGRAGIVCSVAFAATVLSAPVAPSDLYCCRHPNQWYDCAFCCLGISTCCLCGNNLSGLDKFYCRAACADVFGGDCNAVPLP